MRNRWVVGRRPKQQHRRIRLPTVVKQVQVLKQSLGARTCAARHPQDKAKNVLAYVQGDRDPGYGATAKMPAESAVCLAQDGSNAPGGFSTPAAAMGTSLIDRLGSNAGVRFALG